MYEGPLRTNLSLPIVAIDTMMLMKASINIALHGYLLECVTSIAQQLPFDSLKERIFKKHPYLMPLCTGSLNIAGRDLE